MIGATIKWFFYIAFVMVFPIIALVLLGLVVLLTMATFSEGGGFE
jgi:hypothetical protein